MLLRGCLRCLQIALSEGVDLSLQLPDAVFVDALDVVDFLRKEGLTFL